MDYFKTLYSLRYMSIISLLLVAVLIDMFKGFSAIFFSPTGIAENAFKGAYEGKYGNASIAGMEEVTINSIAYVATLVRA